MATDTTEKPARVWIRRIGWLVLLWCGGVLALTAVSLALRYAMAWAGLER